MTFVYFDALHAYEDDSVDFGSAKYAFERSGTEEMIGISRGVVCHRNLDTKAWATVLDTVAIPETQIKTCFM